MNVGVIIIGIIIVVSLIALVSKTNDDQSGVSEGDFLEKEGRIQYDYDYDDNDCDGTSSFRHLQYILRVSSRKQAMFALLSGVLGLFLWFVLIVYLNYYNPTLLYLSILSIPLSVCKLIDPNDRLK